MTIETCTHEDAYGSTFLGGLCILCNAPEPPSEVFALAREAVARWLAKDTKGLNGAMTDLAAALGSRS